MQRVAVINVVGLSPSLIGESTPRLAAFAEKHGMQAFRPAFPAVTCTAQSSMLTGTSPREHGIVANGWYDRESAEVRFWKQSNHLVRGEKIWDALRRQHPGSTCSKLFWWYNMYSSADIAITPRPLYPADGRKVFDIHTQPMDLREAIKGDLGDFPFPTFWGPGAGIACSEWIAASARWVEEREKPSLNLIYLPHLDYCLQKFGPGAPEIAAELGAIDRVAGELIAYLESRGIKILVVSEYGISKVSHPVHLNRIFRAKGWLRIKDELGRETLDAGSSRVFAVADHQVAHVYVNDRSLLREVRTLLDSVEGIEEVRGGGEMWGGSIASDRAGDFVAVSSPNAWFTYYFWDDDGKAPDYARCVDIHRKPGYDPAELFMDPAIPFPRWKIAKFLIRKRLGFRGLMDVIPLDATLVKGSHGRDVVEDGEKPLILGSPVTVDCAEDVFRAILESAK